MNHNIKILMDKLLSIQEYIYQNRPDLLKIVKPEYDNYLNWVSPSTFLKLGHTYKVTKGYPGEEWMLDDYDVYLGDNDTVTYPGVVLHFQRKFPCWNDERKDCWHTPQECYSYCMQDITKEEQPFEIGTHKYKVQWYWHPEHFKKDSDSWRDAIAIEFHYSKSKGMYYDDAPNRFSCNIFWRNGQYDEETDKIFCVSEWNNLRLGADNTCWCVDIGSGRNFYSREGRFEGRFTLTEAKKKYLGVNSLRELTPIFTSLPLFNDNTLKVRLFND